MSPSIARIIFIIFIVVIIIYDGKTEPYHSFPLLIPLLWTLYSASKSIAAWLSPGTTLATQSDIMAGSPIDRAFLISLIVLGLIIIAIRREQFHNLIKDHPWLFVLFIYMGMSVLWSSFPGVSLKRWFRSIGDLIMVFIVFSEQQPFFALQKLMKVTAFILIPLSILLIKYYRSIGVAYSYDGSTMWVGVTTQKNSLGQLACTMAIYFLWRIIFLKSFRYLDILFLLMSLSLLKGSGSATSKTSILVFLVASFTGLVLKKIRGNKGSVQKLLIFALVLFILSTFFAEFFLGSSLVSQIVTASGRDMTLTGRTDLWLDLIQIGISNPFLGSGFGGFWVGNPGHGLWEKHTWHPEQAHNGYIDVFVNIGVVGLFLLGCLIIKTFQNSTHEFSFDRARGSFNLIFLLTVMLYNITEASFIKPTGFLWLLFLMISMNLTQQEKQNEATSI